MYFLSSSSNGRSLHKWSVLLQEDMAIKQKLHHQTQDISPELSKTTQATAVLLVAHQSHKARPNC